MDLQLSPERWTFWGASSKLSACPGVGCLLCVPEWRSCFLFYLFLPAPLPFRSRNGRDGKVGISYRRLGTAFEIGNGFALCLSVLCETRLCLFLPTDIGPVTLTADPVVFQRELRELYVQVGCLPSLFFFLFHGRAKEWPPPSLPCLPLSS